VTTHPRKTPALNILLVLGSLLVCCIAIEAGFRIFDPFPYFSRSSINQNEHGNLFAYDELLGWKGAASGKAELVTLNNKITIAHNSAGFRDIEHRDDAGKPAIVFLGDSFTWGFEVESEEMFVNRLRDMLPGCELFNLAHRGYGTDQALLVFRAWADKGPRDLKLVVLMFCENDVADNNARVRNDKPKPKFELIDNNLVLTGVPVPRVEQWSQVPPAEETSPLKEAIKNVLLRSHFLHYLQFKLWMVRHPNENVHDNVPVDNDNPPDLVLTSRILEELKKEVEEKGAQFVVCCIPSKIEIEKLAAAPPYQAAITRLCQQRSIECFDLAPAFRNTWRRTYYRQGMHWNARGHRVAAQALYDVVTKNLPH